MTITGRPQIKRDLKQWIQDHMFDEVPITIAIIDRDFNIVTANRMFDKVFGPAQGQHCYKVINESDEPCDNCTAAKTFQDGISRVFQKTVKNQEGESISFLVHISPGFDDAGTVEYVVEMCLDVTELSTVRSEFEILFERVPSYIAVIDRDYNVVRCNERLRQTFGEATGLPCYEVFKKRLSKCPDCPVEKTFQDGEVHQAEQIGETREGRETRYLVKSAPLTDADGNVRRVIEMSTDVTAVHDMEQALASMNTLQSALIRNSYDAIVAADTEGRIRVFNAAAEYLFGLAAEDATRLTDIENAMPKPFFQMIAAEMGTCLLPETEINSPDGERIPVRFAGTLLKERGRTLGSVAFIQDLRRMKELEQEKLKAERLAAVGQAVAGLAHGVKNILTGLEGGLYVLKSGIRSNEKEAIEDGWEMLENNIERVSTMVQDFLAFSKGHNPDVREVQPESIAMEVVGLFRDRAKGIGVELTYDMPGKVAPAFLDSEAIHTCLSNLAANAIDACLMSERRPGHVIVRCRDKGDELIYEVEDDGCGMDFEIKQKAFTSFFTTKGKGGTGIGLLVTRKIVQEHGGHIDLESESSRGTMFRLVFPRSRLTALKDRKNAAASTNNAPRKGETLWQMQ